MRFLLMAMALSACDAGSPARPGGGGDVNGPGSSSAGTSGAVASSAVTSSSSAPVVDAGAGGDASETLASSASVRPSGASSAASGASGSLSATAVESGAVASGDAAVPAPSVSGASSSSVSPSDAGSTAYEEVTLDEPTPIGLSGREAMMALSGSYAGVLFYSEETADAALVTLRIAANCDGRPIPEGSALGSGAQAVLASPQPEGPLALAICCEFTLESEDEFAVDRHDVVLWLYEREQAQFSWSSAFQGPETAPETRARTFSGKAYTFRHLLQLSITTSGAGGDYEYATLR